MIPAWETEIYRIGHHLCLVHILNAPRRFSECLVNEGKVFAMFMTCFKHFIMSGMLPLNYFSKTSFPLFHPLHILLSAPSG